MKIKFIFILLLLLLLTGCRKPFKYDLDTMEKDVLSAQIVEVNVTTESLEYTIVNNVENDRLKEFLTDLSMIEFEWAFGSPQIPTEKAIKLNYIDGYELICNTCIMWYNSDDECIKLKDIIVNPEKFNGVILKYIE